MKKNVLSIYNWQNETKNNWKKFKKYRNDLNHQIRKLALDGELFVCLFVCFSYYVQNISCSKQRTPRMIEALIYYKNIKIIVFVLLVFFCYKNIFLVLIRSRRGRKSVSAQNKRVTKPQIWALCSGY